MKRNLLFFREAHSRSLQMNACAFIVLFLFTIGQGGSVNAQNVPWVTWIQQYGTKSIDVSRGISTDENIYVTGYTDGVLPGQKGNPPEFDAYFAKYDPDGNQLWVRQFGTKGAENATGVAVHSSGVYVTGFTDGTFPGQTNFGLEDAFIKKYDPSGNELWTIQFGTDYTDAPADAIGVDATGVYIIGTTWGAFPGYVNAGGRDYFIAKYSHDGTQLWVTQKGTSGTDFCTGIFVDASGFFICGYDNSLGPQDYFIAKYDLAGSELWKSRFGTSGADFVHEISADATSLYVAGFTNGTFTGQTYAGGQYDVFAARHDRDGNMLWVREFGTSKSDMGWGISAGTSEIYITGYTDGALPGQTNAGLSDIFAACYNMDGDPLWTIETGSNNRDFAYTISVVSSYAYINGYTNGILPGQTGVGGSDAFLLKLLLENLPPIADCGDDQVKIITETVQLDGSGSSDPNGSALTYAWSIVTQPEGSSATLSSSTIVNPTFEADVVGDYQVQLIVNDGTFDSDPCLVTITVVQTPQEATQYLIGDVQELVASGVLSEDQGDGLIDKLEAAIENMNLGNYNAAINNLDAFINQVNAFLNAGVLSDEQADALIVAAERIIEFLESLILKQGGVIASGNHLTADILTWINPNPFNTVTTIYYTLPVDLFVTLKVFDPNGTEVSVLVNEQKEKGNHKVTWNAEGMPAGIYFYRFTAGSQSSAGKMMVVR